MTSHSTQVQPGRARYLACARAETRAGPCVTKTAALADTHTLEGCNPACLSVLSYTKVGI